VTVTKSYKHTVKNKNLNKARMLRTTVSTCKRISFFILATNLRSFSILLLLFAVFGMKSSGAASKDGAKRDIYVPPDIAAMTPDARDWYLKGVSNANKDVSTFKGMTDKLAKGESVSSQWKNQLQDLLGQANDANENTKVLVPRLSSLIDSLSSWSQKPISLWSKMKMKATIWYINGKRDNKSYYLQNGGALWCKLRMDLVKPITDKNKEAQEISNELSEMEDSLLVARDELDDAAQVYVKGVNRLVTLVKDISENEDEIRSVIGTLKEGGDKSSPSVLKRAQESVDMIKDYIHKLGRGRK